MSKALIQTFGNPSSVHRAGQMARQQLEQARRRVAGFMGVGVNETVFTSGGTEANNLAILGVVRAAGAQSKHVITTAIEHPSVLEPCRHLEREGAVISYALPDTHGVISVDAIERLLRPETVLVSVMHANNESGAVQPVQEIAALIQRRRLAGQQIYFHVDGVQAAGKLPLNVASWGIDLYSISSHKLYAPKGCGVLYVRNKTPLVSLQTGGRHERGHRAGTENVPGAIALAAAIEFCGDHDSRSVATMRDSFEQTLRQSLTDFTINAQDAVRLANTSNILFRGISAEALVIALDMRGMAVSTGSACSSGSVEPSHVLLAMGLSEEEAKSSVRFSFGRGNTAEDIHALVHAISQLTSRMRKPTLQEVSLV